MKKEVIFSNDSKFLEIIVHMNGRFRTSLPLVSDFAKMCPPYDTFSRIM